jgi:hypothetical protein
MTEPFHLLKRLKDLARYERRLRLMWGLARCIGVVGAVLVACCFVDWLVDRWQETPEALRWLLRCGLMATGSGCLYWWLVRPLGRGLSPAALALWVETRDPRHGHRLISAVQLNDPQGDQQGMSTALIGAVTEQAEAVAQLAPFTSMVDVRRRIWSWSIFSGVLLVLGAFLLALPATTMALLQRQLGSDVRIPRSVHLQAVSESLWPSGEPVLLKYLVTCEDFGSAGGSDWEGTVQIVPEGQPAEVYPLTWLEAGPTAGQAYFMATIPASSTPFTYRAWLGDGRSYLPSQVQFTPRPILTAWEAWLRLPAYLGVQSNGHAFETAQPKGDLRPIPGSSARIQVVTQTPVGEAFAELLAPLAPELGVELVWPAGPAGLAFLLHAQQAQGWTPTSAGPLFTVQREPLNLNREGMAGSAVIPLPTDVSAYRVLVKDRHGFTNRPIPRRAITFKADETPQVTLLPERFGNTGDGPDDLDLEGMPVPLGRPLRVAYRVRDDFALDSARLRYRLNEGEWQHLSLTEVPSPKSSAVFDLNSGAFAGSGANEQTPFHAIPQSETAQSPGRAQGGGRFDFQTRAIPGIKLGDVLEYFVEVTDRHPDANRVPGRSAIRRKTVVTEAQFVEWVVQTLQQENRLRQLERQQRRVFEPGN